MTLEKLTYTPHVNNANDRPVTMVIVVDQDMYQKYVAGDKSLPLSSIVDSFEVFKFDKPGSKQGPLGKPSHAELQDTFGTTDETRVVEFMLQRGHLHGGGNRATKKEQAASPSHMEELLNADRRAY